MSVTEIILLILGILIFILSFILPAKGKKSEDAVQIDEEQIREILDKEVSEARKQISDIVDETITYSMEKTERSMERLTNEKMMAVNEYSDTVLEQINKNHKEAVFLYDMLNDKHENLKTTVSEAAKTASEVKQTVKDAEITAREAEEKVNKVQESLLMQEKDTEMKTRQAEQVVQEVAEFVNFRTEDVPEKEEENEKIVLEPSEEQLADKGNEFVPIKPKKVEVIIPPVQEEKAEKKESRKSKAEKVELNIASTTGGRSQNNNERILELHKAGKSNMAIAKELGLGIGEVKLVIDLFEGI